MTRRDTRELILQTSLALFNAQGEPNVSTNEIAMEADISPGNLYYHFHNRDEISFELFKRYLVELTPLLEPAPDEAPPSLEELYLRLHLIFEIMGRYRFIYRNLADLFQRIDNLQQAITGLLARIEAALAHLLTRLESAGMMTIKERDARVLVDNVVTQMTCWIAYAELRDPEGLDDGSALTTAAARVLYLFVPYLSEPEADQFRALAQDYQNA